MSVYLFRSPNGDVLVGEHVRSSEVSRAIVVGVLGARAMIKEGEATLASFHATCPNLARARLGERIEMNDTEFNQYVAWQVYAILTNTEG
jgi:hypothetical protein